MWRQIVRLITSCRSSELSVSTAKRLPSQEERHSVELSSDLTRQEGKYENLVEGRAEMEGPTATPFCECEGYAGGGEVLHGKIFQNCKMKRVTVD
jgi:hypothetical protein